MKSKIERILRKYAGINPDNLGLVDELIKLFQYETRCLASEVVTLNRDMQGQDYEINTLHDRIKLRNGKITELINTIKEIEENVKQNAKAAENLSKDKRFDVHFYN